MSKNHRFKSLVAFCLAAPMSAGWAAPITEINGAGILAPGSTVAGLTIGEWTARWWQWAVGQSIPNDAFTDSNGANADVDQSGPVFFVAGTAGSNETRSFSVPAGNHLLIPLLNISYSNTELGIDDPEEIQDQVESDTDTIDSLQAIIDGVNVADMLPVGTSLFDFREQSPQFSYTAAPDNPFGVPAGLADIAYADGYWLMVEPLASGTTHEIVFGGGASAFDFSVTVTDTITAIPVPASLGLFSLGLLALGAVSRQRV